MRDVNEYSSLEYRSVVPVIDYHNATRLIGLKQIISSPGYPSNYADDQSRSWTVIVDSGFKTELSYDFVKVYDGSSNIPTSPAPIHFPTYSVFKSFQLLPRLCKTSPVSEQKVDEPWYQLIL
ncbi:hypothetical protein AM593_04828, partial [Mytilus galloprovincialis]